MSTGNTTRQDEAAGMRSLRHDAYEQAYQEALAWRRRMRHGTATLVDRNMWAYYFDLLAVSASAWRGRRMTG